jgi:Family of unknown function (DUF6105)
MRYVIILWVAPLLLFWGWFGLSFYDINFGYVILSRQLHDLVFKLYGEILGIDPDTIPLLLVRTCIFDAFLLGAILAFRRRRQIGNWMRTRTKAS